MKKQKMFVAVAAAMLALNGVWAATETVGGVTWTYFIQDGEAVITAPNTESSCGEIPGLQGDLTLPSTLGGCPVTRLDSGVLWGATELTSLVIPDSIRRIENGALQYMTRVTNVTIGAGLTYFGLPFCGCVWLESIEVSAENTAFAIRDGVFYDKLFTHLYAYPCGLDAETFRIPDGIMTIGIYSFWGTYRLKHITVPESVTEIDHAAFYDCSDLESIVFDGDAPNVLGQAFVRLPDSCVVYIQKGTVGWDDDGDGKWQGATLKYNDGSGFVNPASDPAVAPSSEPDAVSDSVPTFGCEYNGYLIDNADTSETLAGTIQIKVGKPSRSGLASIKAAVQLGAKKISLKAIEKGRAQISPDAPTTVALVGNNAEECTVILGADGVSGEYGSCKIVGARNLFTSKDKDEQKIADGLISKWTMPVNVVWGGNAVTVTAAKKGKVKISGIVNNAKVSVASQLIIGDEEMTIPVLGNKRTNLAFLVSLPKDGGDVVVEGLGEEVLVGKVVTPPANLTFSLGDGFEGIAGVQSALLPDGLSIKGGAKWDVGKAATVKLNAAKTAAEVIKDAGNDSGMKLTYKSKDGSFKGSFKVYAVEGGRLKKFTANVTGLMIGGKGYGTATIKKPFAAATVTIE